MLRLKCFVSRHAVKVNAGGRAAVIVKTRTNRVQSYRPAFARMAADDPQRVRRDPHCAGSRVDSDSWLTPIWLALASPRMLFNDRRDLRWTGQPSPAPRCSSIPQPAFRGFLTNEGSHARLRYATLTNAAAWRCTADSYPTRVPDSTSEPKGIESQWRANSGSQTQGVDAPTKHMPAPWRYRCVRDGRPPRRPPPLHTASS